MAPAPPGSAVARLPATRPAGPATGLVLPGRRLPVPGTEPVFVLSADQPGPALLRLLLDAHPELACPPETRLAALRDTQSDLRKKKAALEGQLNSLMERVEF